ESRRPDDEDLGPPHPASSDVQAADHLLLVVTPDPSSAALIRRGRRVAGYPRPDCPARYRSKKSDFADLEEGERERLARPLNFARALRIETRILQGLDVAEAVVSFARLHAVTQIFVTREKSSALRSWFASAFVQRIVNLARDMQVTVAADRSVR